MVTIPVFVCDVILVYVLYKDLLAVIYPVVSVLIGLSHCRSQSSSFLMQGVKQVQQVTAWLQ